MTSLVANVLPAASGMLCFFCLFNAVAGTGCESIFTTTPDVSDVSGVPLTYKSPFIFTVPTTSKFAVGAEVPIPRFPQISNRPTSTPFMRNGIIFCEGSRLLTSISFGGEYIE
jgi:hypothetical protein